MLISDGYYFSFTYFHCGSYYYYSLFRRMIKTKAGKRGGAGVGSRRMKSVVQGSLLFHRKLEVASVQMHA